MEENLLSNLRADSGIILRTGTHNSRPVVDWGQRPDEAPLPALVLTRISTDRLYTHGGAATLTAARVQCDCYGTTYQAVALLERALLAKMESGGTGWEAFLLSHRDFDPVIAQGGERIFRKMSDFNVWYKD